MIFLLLMRMASGSAQDQEYGIFIPEGASIVTSGSSSIVIRDGGVTNNGTFHASPENQFIMEGASPQNITGNGTIIFSNLTINNTVGVTLGSSVDVSGILLCNGIMNSNGNLTLLATATSTAMIDGSGTGSVNGVVIMQRYLASRYGYTYVSSPFQSSLVDDLIDESIFSIYWYDENRYVGGAPVSGWVDYNSPANILYPLTGYATHFGFDDYETVIDLTGVVNDGEIALPVFNHDHVYSQGFNLCGNPYPSPVDWHEIRQLSTNIDDAVYIFKNSTTDPFGGVYGSYINGVSGDGTVSNIIPAMQGFFVHVNDGPFPVEGSLRMNNSVRVTGQSESPAKSVKGSSKPLVRLTSSFTSYEESIDYTVIYFDDKATEEFDGSLDALKLFNTDLQTPSLYSVTPLGRNLSINALPGYPDMPSMVRLGLNIQVDGTVSIGVSQISPELENLDFYFVDRETGIELEVTPGMDYKIYLAAGEYLNRFYLNLSGVSTRISKPKTDQDVLKAWYSGDVLNVQVHHLNGVEGFLRIFNLSGQQMFVNKIEEPGHYELSPGLSDGIFILSLDSGGVRASRKIVKTGR